MKQKTKNFIKSAIENKFNLAVSEIFHEIQETKFRRLIQDEIKNKPAQYNDNVCIILDKGMGDFLLFAYYFEVLVEYYSRNGKNVYVLCEPYSMKFLKFCRRPLPKIILIEANKDPNHIYKELIAEYYNFFEVVIVPIDWIAKYCCNIIRQLNPKTIYSVGKRPLNARKISLSDKKLLSKIQVFPGTDKGFYTERHRILTSNLTGEAQDLMLIEPEAGERIIEGEYYLINIGSSSKMKVWPVENVIILVKMLNDKLNAKPIIIGNADLEIIDQLERNGINCNFVNVMDIPKTISLCNYAKFVITNDTGLYHLSVCLGKPTYVISAGDYLEHFLPYPEKLPRAKVDYIMRDKGCEICNKHISCFINRKRRTLFECVSAISPQKVFESLKEEYDLKKDQ
jgi:ADP-heptose:LPS heptosyltransferase